MKSLADIALDYYWFINFCSDEELDPDTAVKLIEELSWEFENELTESDKEELKKAAAERLAWWLREPDEFGHTPRKLLTADQKEFLESIAAGHFSGAPDDEES